MIDIHRIVRIARAASILLLTAFATTGCHPHIKANLSPLAPHQPPPDPPPSVLTVNVNASITQFSGSLDDAIPSSFNTGSVCAALGLACVQGFLGREPLRLNVASNHLSLRSLLHYELDGNFIGISGTCGKPDNTRRRATVAYDANVSIAPDWKVTVADGHSAAAAVDSCKITAANIDVTAKAMDALNRALDGLTQEAAQKLAESTVLHDRATEAWRVLSSPIVLSPSAFLDLRPQAVGLGRITGANETLSAMISVSALPVLSAGTPPASTPAPPATLPALGPAPADDRVHVMALVRVPFDVLNGQLTRIAVGKEFRVKSFFGTRTAKIVKTTVKGSGNTLAIGLDLDGSVTGTAWLIGRINYRPADRIAAAEIVDVDVDTKNFLVKAVQWLSPNLLLNAAREALGDFTFDVGQKSDELREQAGQALNRQVSPTVAARTEIDAPELRGPFTDVSAFLFTVSLTGRLQIDVAPAGQPLSTGNEIRYVSVFFETSGDDKDAEEPVTLSLIRNGAVLAQRQVGVTERWGDSPPENQGPYFLTVPVAQNVSDCHALSLRVRKEPSGSSTGKGWKNVMHARLFLANGTDVPAARSPFDQWGDGSSHPFDRTFGLCDHTP